MLEHFISGSGTNYTNDKLTAEVKKHSKTVNFYNEATNRIKNCIAKNNGNINNLYYDENLWIKPTERKNHPVVNALNQKELCALPYYGIDNGVPGLSLAIDSWHGAKIEISSFQLSGTSYSGKLTFTFYDHFGLDTEDLSKRKYGFTKAGVIDAFRQWYIMQHWDSLNASVHPKPYVTNVSFDVPFSGSY